MRQFMKRFSVFVAVVVTASSLGAQGMPDGGPEAAAKMAVARVRLRNAEAANNAAMANLKSAVERLRVKLDDPEARNKFDAALAKAMAVRRNLEEARKQLTPADRSEEQAEAKSTEPVAQDQRYVRVQNETSKPLTLWLQVYTKTGKGAWAWLPAGAPQADKAAGYRIGAGQSSYLGQDGRKLAGSKIRFWVQWQGGEFKQYRERRPVASSGTRHRRQPPLPRGGNGNVSAQAHTLTE